MNDEKRTIPLDALIVIPVYMSVMHNVLSRSDFKKLELSFVGTFLFHSIKHNQH